MFSCRQQCCVVECTYPLFIKHRLTPYVLCSPLSLSPSMRLGLLLSWLSLLALFFFLGPVLSFEILAKSCLGKLKANGELKRCTHLLPPTTIASPPRNVLLKSTFNLRRQCYAFFDQLECRNQAACNLCTETESLAVDKTIKSARTENDSCRKVKDYKKRQRCNQVRLLAPFCLIPSYLPSTFLEHHHTALRHADCSQIRHHFLSGTAREFCGSSKETDWRSVHLCFPLSCHRCRHLDDVSHTLLACLCRYSISGQELQSQGFQIQVQCQRFPVQVCTHRSNALPQVR